MHTENSFPMHVGIVVTSAAQLASVYALLGGVALAAVAATAPAPKVASTPQPDAQAAPVADQANAGDAPVADVSGEVDTGGHPWSEALHASTKTKTKDGYWRMKVGVARPDNLAGFPKADGPASSSAPGAASPAGTSATAPAASVEGDDDEFAAFRQALDKDDAKDAAVPARKYTDADLGALCNQAAVKLGDPAPVKALIADYVPEGTVAHSRNIPEARRADFVKAVETKAGIEFAG